jgi:hypothetical protein
LIDWSLAIGGATITLEQFAGAGLMLLFLADIFLKLLSARAGTALLALTATGLSGRLVASQFFFKAEQGKLVRPNDPEYRPQAVQVRNMHG